MGLNKDDILEIVTKALDYHSKQTQNQKAFDQRLHEEDLKSQNEWQEKMFAQTRKMAYASWAMAIASWALFFVSLLKK